AVFQKTAEELDPAACFAASTASGFHGFCAPLAPLRRNLETRRSTWMDLLEEHAGLGVPVLTSDFDLIRNNQEDTSRALDELAWMGDHAFTDLVVTLTQGARSYQIDDQEYLMVLRAFKRIVERARSARVRLSLRLTPRHVADGLPSADRILKESRDESVLLSVDLHGMGGEGKIDGPVAVRYFASHLGFLEIDPADPQAPSFYAWMAAQPATLFPREPTFLFRDSASAERSGTLLFQQLFGAPTKASKKAPEERKERRGEARKKNADSFPY
ncbi:MAG: hypothetical protein J0L75_14470, partial [Spirochaetes bacterium]|nr:hypothetical protein [Spirochaetota bacterium]